MSKLLFPLTDQDAVLDVLEAIVVLVQHRPGSLEVKVLLAGVAPGQAGQPVQVRPSHTVTDRRGGGGKEGVERERLSGGGGMTASVTDPNSAE